MKWIVNYRNTKVAEENQAIVPVNSAKSAIDTAKKFFGDIEVLSVKVHSEKNLTTPV